MTGTEIVHIPYKGGAMAINDLIAGHVQVMFESLNSISTFARSGKVKALAVSGPRRSPGFPNLPTIAEAGVPGYDATTWSGVIGPAGMARPIVDKLNSSIGDEPAGGTPEEFAEVIRRDSAKWAEVVKRSGAKID
jgi:tripartite-type tricarboxylate transporter receptor subunit TctC